MPSTKGQGLSGCLEWKNCFLPTEIHNFQFSAMRVCCHAAFASGGGAHELAGGAARREEMVPVHCKAADKLFLQNCAFYSCNNNLIFNFLWFWEIAKKKVNRCHISWWISLLWKWKNFQWNWKNKNIIWPRWKILLFLQPELIGLQLASSLSGRNDDAKKNVSFPPFE